MHENEVVFSEESENMEAQTVRTLKVKNARALKRQLQEQKDAGASKAPMRSTRSLGRAEVR